mmetsp:Transcript_56036/g.127392  ORF Transcript_56036/g.127392 Transcript_56036/m.127392 type:complete len:267 (-) Transcript_56036:579-1379(-)
MSPSPPPACCPHPQHGSGLWSQGFRPCGTTEYHFGRAHGNSAAHLAPPQCPCASLPVLWSPPCHPNGHPDPWAYPCPGGGRPTFLNGHRQPSLCRLCRLCCFCQRHPYPCWPPAPLQAPASVRVAWVWSTPLPAWAVHVQSQPRHPTPPTSGAQPNHRVSGNAPDRLAQQARPSAAWPHWPLAPSSFRQASPHRNLVWAQHCLRESTWKVSVGRGLFAAWWESATGRRQQAWQPQTVSHNLPCPRLRALRRPWGPQLPLTWVKATA